MIVITIRSQEELNRRNRQELIDVVLELHETIKKLCVYHDNQRQEYEQKLEQLEAELAKLKAQQAQDSHNSSRPPSSDGLKKKSRRPKKNGSCSAGGQKGHKGETLMMVDTPDSTIVCPVKNCIFCGRPLDHVEPTDTQRRQVFDLPPQKVEVTEYQVDITTCPFCQTINKGSFPEDVTQPTQYGARIQAMAVYLSNFQLIPYDRCHQFFRDIYSQSISPATIAKANHECFEQLAEFEQHTIRKILGAPAVHFDETGFRINSKRQWLHTAGTSDVTFYSAHAKRGQKATDDIGILPQFNGIAIHDFWRTYFKYDCKHSLCNAHHLRELTFVFEHYEQTWADDMIELLCQIKESVEQAQLENKNQLDTEAISQFETRYQTIIDNGYSQNPLLDPPPDQARKRGRVKKSKPRNLLERLDNYRREALTFMYDFRVPFDNNLAERDLRMMKVQQKVSGCFRTGEGAQIFCRNRGYISTIKKQNQNVLEEIQAALLKNPFMPQLE